MLRILFGARVEPSFGVPIDGDGNPTYEAGQKWEVGNLLEVGSDEKLKLATSTTVATDGAIGIAKEYRREVTGTDYSQDQTYASKKGSITVDETILETDMIASGLESETLPCDLAIDDDGMFCKYVSGLKVGKILKQKETDDDAITLLFSPQY